MELRLMVVSARLDSSKHRGQTKGTPWSSNLGVGSEASNLTTTKIMYPKETNGGCRVDNLRKRLTNRRCIIMIYEI
jgi:hypothetical protein